MTKALKSLCQILGSFGFDRREHLADSCALQSNINAFSRTPENGAVGWPPGPGCALLPGLVLAQ